MRKLQDIKNEEALDVIAELLEPLSEIFSDPEFVKVRNDGKKTLIEKVQWAIVNHKKAIIKALAIIDGEPYETYEISALMLPIRILEIVNDKDLISLFTVQGQITELTSSGSAMENTGADKR